MRRPLVACVVLACTLVAAPAPALAKRSDPRVTTNCRDTAHRPRAIQTCAIDFVERFRKLHWSRWGKAVATGRGRWTPGCQPVVGVNCPRERAATVRLSRPKRCGGYRVFTRLRARGGGLTSVIDLDCPIAQAATAQLPDCTGPPPATLGGVPRRMRYGNAAYPHINLTTTGVVQTATIQVGKRAPMTVVENGAPLPVPLTPVYMRFDDPPLRVRLVTEEPGPCRRVQDRRIHGVRHIEASQGCFHSGYRPRNIFTCEVNNGLRVSGAKWRRWNRDVARGTGQWTPSCVPIGGATCSAPFRARLVLSRIHYCPQYGEWIYTRLRVTPVAGGRSQKVRLGCPQIASEGE